jgi:hypothetical protein
MAVLKTIGKMNALTAITKIKDGHAPQLRQALEGLTGAGGGKIASLRHHPHRALGHLRQRQPAALRHHFNGDVEAYMRDFAERAPEGIDAIWGHCEGYPGARDYPKLRDYILGSAIETTRYYCVRPRRARSRHPQGAGREAQGRTPFLDQLRLTGRVRRAGGLAPRPTSATSRAWRLRASFPSRAAPSAARG